MYNICFSICVIYRLHNVIDILLYFVYKAKCCERHSINQSISYSKMSSSANTSRRRGILALLLHRSKIVWHEHINKSISFHMQIRFLNSRLPF